MVMGNHVSNYSQKREISRTRKHLEYAGLKFEQLDGLWLVRLPNGVFYKGFGYKHLTRAINAADKYVRNLSRLDNLPENFGSQWREAIKRYQEYEPDFREIW